MTARPAHALLVAPAMLVMAGALGYGEPGMDGCASYLAARQRLAPVAIPSREALRTAVGGAETSTVELIGDVSGMASSSVGSEGEVERTVMMTLDDGSSVAMHAAASVEPLRVGDRIAAIASIQRQGSPTNDLVLEAWVREWDLPREEPAEGAPEEAEDTAIEQELPQQLPRPAAVATCRVDAIDVWRRWVLKHNPRLSRQQATNIVRWVLHYAQEYNVNHKLVFALIKWESWFDPGCVSHAGAMGLMQLMPGTARSLGVSPRNVQQNIEGGVRYLAEQLAAYRDLPNYQRVILALACYNAGPNAVEAAGHRVPAIAETQRYVRKVSSTFYELHQAGMP
ncbi:MAG: lytic transglycosylase domain-containing protein [Armatimonadota bacterium]|nr:lytic transglycosylase domain-containing protein [Armatimonadota bacterium]